jgi:hypothetical protein
MCIELNATVAIEIKVQVATPARSGTDGQQCRSIKKCLDQFVFKIAGVAQ